MRRIFELQTDGEIRDLIAHRLLGTFLPIVFVAVALIELSSIALHVSFLQQVPALAALGVTAVCYLVHLKGRSLLAARIMVLVMLVLVVANTILFGSFRTVGSLLAVAIVLLWSVYFLSRALTIGVLGFVILFNSAVAWAIVHGHLRERLFHDPLSGLMASHVSYLALLVSLLAPIRLLFEAIKTGNRQRKALSESQSFTMQAVDNSRQIFGWISKEGVLEFINETALNLYKTSREEVLGRPLWEIPWFLEREQGDLRRSVDSIRQSRLPVHLHVTHQGEKRWEFELFLRPTFTSAGELSLIVVEGLDVTEEILAIERQQELTERLHQAQRFEALGNLAGGIAHDFNNSLGGMLGALELLEEGREDVDQDELLGIIRRAGNSASDLTRKLLAFSGQSARSNRPVDCLPCVLDTLSVLKHSVDKAIEIRCDNRARRTVVRGDRSMLLNAFLNVAINGTHAMPTGGALGFELFNCTVTEERIVNDLFGLYPGEYLVVAIRDTGCGIPREIQSRIFEPLFTTKEEGKGTGLGLAAVYATVKEHNGAIALTSEQGVGTTFSLYLPLCDESPGSPLQEEPLSEAIGTILYIDDEPSLLKTGTLRLENLGYTVVPAANGEEGLDAFARMQGRIALVVLDIMMPGMNGIDVLKKIREQAPDCPVVISTGMSVEAYQPMLDDLGVSGILKKPVPRRDLLKMLEAVLGS